ncbi:MAG: hypothetical protein GYB31_05955 [Bacteroidetes bacterium]|nr:hypothetical protein [Bacteroidota bacterium]
MEEPIYREVQKFNQPWIWIILIGLQLLFLWGIVQQVILGKPFGTNPAPDLLLIFFALFPFALIILFRNMTLTTSVEKDQVVVEFAPFTTRIISEVEISKYYIREYKPIKEYGGWGLRFGKGRAFTATGHKGLQLELSDGDRILIGTQNPEELEKAIVRMFIV